MSILINGNSKLGKNIAQFGIPNTTCTDKTKHCEKYCYASRGNFQFENAQRSMKLNYELSQKSDFSDRIFYEIDTKNIKASKGYKSEVKWVRIHPSGDFYNQTYANKWFKAAKKLPSVNFLAYTKSSRVNFSKRPKNLVLYRSVDVTTVKSNATLKDCNLALVAKIGKNIPHMTKLSLEVPGLKKPVDFRVCNSKCDVCKYCFLNKGNVVFNQR